MEELCAQQREWPVQSSWGWYLFPMFKSKELIPPARGMSRSETEERHHQTYRGGNWPLCYLWTLKARGHPCPHCLSTAPTVSIILQRQPINLTRSLSYGLLLIQFWPLDFVTLGFLSTGTLLWELLTLYKSHMQDTMVSWVVFFPSLSQPSPPDYARNGSNASRPDQWLSPTKCKDANS